MKMKQINPVESELIDKLISLSVKKGDIVSEEELNKILLGSILQLRS